MIFQPENSGGQSAAPNVNLLTDVNEPSANYPAQVYSQTILAPYPPIAELITVGRPNSRGFITITGASGAVLPSGIVAVACLNTATVEFVKAGSDGSFVATLFAPPGSDVEVKHAYPFVSLQEIEATFGGTTSGDIMVGWMNATPGTILRVPLSSGGSGGETPFGLAGTIEHESGAGFWSMQGTLGPESSGGGGVSYSITGTMFITTPALTAGMDLSSVMAWANFKLRLMFDETGRQLPVNQVFVSDFMAPTGLWVSRGTPDWSSISAPVVFGAWTQTGDTRLQATISATLKIPAGTKPGYYRPIFGIGFQGIPLGAPNQRTLRPGFVYGMNGGLSIIRVGQPAAPRLLWTALTDTLYGGSRGTIARADKPTYGLIPFTAFQSGTFVIPRVDARTGVPIPYRLEPFLPLIALSDRGTPNPPLVPFLLPSGQLQVKVQKPDGTVETLGPAPFRQSTSATPAFLDAKLRDNDGGAMQEVYQLSTMDDRFAYQFEQDGLHLITMTGSVEDIWGNVYQGEGTYDVLVARPLRLESNQLPTIPYELDDAFSPGLHLYPPVPAYVEVRFTLLPNSDPAQAITHVITGTANRFGYFYPTGAPDLMNAPGEYRVDITAVYADRNGDLWAGSATWGNVVERPGTPLIAHGRRGLDVPGITSTVWFYHDQLNFSGVAHTNYPYFSGDIFWGMEGHRSGGDSILPEITIEDAGGSIYQIIQRRWGDAHPGLAPWETMQDRIDADEVPLASGTSDGSDLQESPEKVDLVSYVYCTSQRPGARVHEVIAEGCGGIQYWRFNATYGDQVGVEGDLPNDLKWEFGGAVFRLISETLPIKEYAIYGSLWVLLPGDDVDGPRVTPPFRGSGALNGGPILTLKGEPVDLFFMPRGVQPGDTLEVGDFFSFSGHVGPPLNSHLAVTVTTPNGTIIPFGGQANKVGWFYNPSITFPVEELGIWTVQVRVQHNEPIPGTGLIPTSFNKGGVLGSAEGRYHFYVVDNDSPRLPAISPRPGYLSWPTDPVNQVPITVTTVPITVPIPSGLTDVVVSYTIRMPGFLLDEGTIVPSGRTFTILYDPLALHKDFPNLDLTAKDAPHPGLADPVLITFLLSGKRDGVQVYRAGGLFFDGEEVRMPEPQVVNLPAILKGD